jgi:hypothetical protein
MIRAAKSPHKFIKPEDDKDLSTIDIRGVLDPTAEAADI